MNLSSTVSGIDWSPVLSRMQRNKGHRLPIYPGDLKTALLEHAGLSNHPKGEAAYQLAHKIAQLTTYCDPEITYWFSHLVALIDSYEMQKVSFSYKQESVPLEAALLVR